MTRYYYIFQSKMNKNIQWEMLFQMIPSLLPFELFTNFQGMMINS